ncbi:MAG: hypothetical protein CM15mP68_2160 [Pseudomonadota bacterium]|nr:MAG: hypothetical protein CM15mP68_2160 [Pseudomonadota bacterium]
MGKRGSLLSQTLSNLAARVRASFLGEQRGGPDHKPLRSDSAVFDDVNNADKVQGVFHPTPKYRLHGKRWGVGHWVCSVVAANSPGHKKGRANFAKNGSLDIWKLLRKVRDGYLVLKGYAVVLASIPKGHLQQVISREATL